MSIARAANLGVRFLLELCALAAIGYWGFTTGESQFTKIALGIGCPLLAAVVWGLFIAPKASISAPEPVRLSLEIIIFGSAAAALYSTGHRALAGAFVLAVTVNRGLIYLWRQ